MMHEVGGMDAVVEDKSEALSASGGDMRAATQAVGGRRGKRHGEGRRGGGQAGAQHAPGDVRDTSGDTRAEGQEGGRVEGGEERREQARGPRPGSGLRLLLWRHRVDPKRAVRGEGRRGGLRFGSRGWR